MVDLGAGSLKDVAISLFGTNDKAAVVVGIVVVSMVLGAAVGIVAARRPWVAVAAFAVAGVLGFVAALDDPLASALAAGLACALGAACGAACLLLLLRLAPPPAAAPDPAPAALPDPRVKQADRRTFFAVAGGLGLAAALGTLASRGLRGPSRATASRAGVTLPPPARTVPLPADQPFAVDGLTPYVTANDAFYRIDTAVFVPQVDAADVAAAASRAWSTGPSRSPTTSCSPWTWSRRRSRWRASPTTSAAASSATPCGGACR